MALKMDDWRNVMDNFIFKKTAVEFLNDGA